MSDVINEGSHFYYTRVRRNLINPKLAILTYFHNGEAPVKYTTLIRQERGVPTLSKQVYLRLKGYITISPDI